MLPVYWLIHARAFVIHKIADLKRLSV